jgi:hypothetical protein
VAAVVGVVVLGMVGLGFLGQSVSDTLGAVGNWI